MFRRFVEWLKRLFGMDSNTEVLPPPGDATQEVSSSDRIDVTSCEVVSISFDDEDDDAVEVGDDGVMDFKI